METQPRRQSATIYRFPPGGRAGLARRDAGRAALPIPRFGGAWYHEQAIKDAKDENTPSHH